MKFLKPRMTSAKQWFLSTKGFALVMAVTGVLFIAVGIRRFWVRPEHFGLLSVLGCSVAAFGAFHLLLLSDYVFHHAPLVFIPWLIALIYFAFLQPHFAVGLGLALWFMLATELRD